MWKTISIFGYKINAKVFDYVAPHIKSINGRVSKLEVWKGKERVSQFDRSDEWVVDEVSPFVKKAIIKAIDILF